MTRSLRGVPFPLLAASAVVGQLALAAPASAQLAPRLAVEQRGDVALIGNTLAHNCADDVPEPVVGSVGACGGDQDDSGADVLWSLGADGQGPPVASTSVSPDEASSVAVLALPQGAEVTHARLYWSAMDGEGNRELATLSRLAAELQVEASATATFDENGNTFYQSSADVTEFVRAGGAGAYRVGGVDIADPVGLDDSAHYAAWWLVVFYSLASEPVRHLGVYDGFVRVGEESSSVTLSGFEIPPGPVQARLGVVAYEGDGTVDGDQLRVGAAAPLGAADAVGAADNFFDGSRRGISGAPIAAPGDLPEASGAPDSLSGLDLHVLDIADVLAPGQTSAEVAASTTSDSFVFAGLVLSAVTAAPDLVSSTESVLDVNGPPLRPGDELEYTVEVNNSGTGRAQRVTLRAPLPPNVRYVPGSLVLGADDAPLALTDAVDVDGGELVLGAGEELVVRFGTGDGASGGPLEVGETRAARYRVVLSADAAGSVVSQAELIASSESGAITSTARSDADLASPGVSPTEIVIDGCGRDAECPADAPRCELSAAPTRCVQCLSDADCSGLAPSCDPSRVCVCTAAAADEALCDGKDDDCDGQVDEGLAGAACEVAVGACLRPGVLVCDVGGEVRCSAASLELERELCDNGIDDDCDGATDASDSDCAGAEPLGGVGSEPLTPPAAEPSSARAPASSLTPTAADTPRAPADPGAASSLGGGASCQLGPVGASSARAPWLLVGLALACARRRSARRV
jgi:clumping factor A